jgi:vacuolar-type H+-ATPase subunit E/Vma4
MEVLKTDDKLREEIINDAKVKTDRILKKAQAEAEEIEKSSLEQIDKVDGEYKTSIQKEIDLEVKKIFASVDIEVKKKTLEITGNHIDDIFNKIKKSIEDGKLISYKDFILKLIQKASSELKSSSYILEAGKKELAKVSKDSFKSLKLAGGEIKEIIEADIEGFKFYSSDRKKSAYISLDNFIDRLKDDERIKIYEILVKGEA